MQDNEESPIRVQFHDILTVSGFFKILIKLSPDIVRTLPAHVPKIKKKKYVRRRKMCAPDGPHKPVSCGFSKEFIMNR
jgi:hypothetical protein